MPSRAEAKVRKTFVSAPERGTIPFAHYVELTPEELAALEQEARNVNQLLAALHNPDRSDGSRRYEGAAGWISYQVAKQLKFWTKAFENINAKVETPTALSFVRRDYVQIDDGKIRASETTAVWHVTSGAGTGEIVSDVAMIDLYECVRRFLYTNIEDDRERENKQCEFLRILEEHVNVVICPNHDAFMATRGQNRASG